MTRKLDWRKAEDNRVLPQVLVGGLIAVLSGLFFFSIYPTSGPTEFIGTVRAIAPSFQDGPNLTVATVELDDGTQVVAQAGPLDRPEFCRHSVAALRVTPLELYR